MKRINKISIFLSLLITFCILSCAKEERLDVTADFKMTIVNNDHSVPVRVEIENNSVGADTYEWAFEGAGVTSSTEKTPKPVYYNTPGKYKVTLKASNKDGSRAEKSIDIQIDAAMVTDFDWELQGSDISPVTLQMINKSLGATSYQWIFDNGSPASSSEINPKVTFSTPGEHKVKLTITNEKETYSTEKTIIVKPAMTVDFDWTLDFVDQDYEAPVVLHLNNKSTNAISYEWTFANSATILSTGQHPDIEIKAAGTYTLQLKATNDKESKTFQKQIVVHANKNLLTFNNIKLGINTAHAAIGCFFSSVLGKVITMNEVSAENGPKIDFAFFGLNSTFSYNQFVSPDQVQHTAFVAIPNATHTKIINSQELVGRQLTAAQFDAIETGAGLSNLIVNESTKALTPFDNTENDRVILFQTADGRKGAIKIISYTVDGQSSYILANIKIQKTP